MRESYQPNGNDGIEDKSDKALAIQPDILLTQAQEGDFKALQHIHRDKASFSRNQLIKLFNELQRKVSNEDTNFNLITNLAYCFAHGIGYGKCTYKAIKYYELAAQYGNMDAILQLAEFKDEKIDLSALIAKAKTGNIAAIKKMYEYFNDQLERVGKQNNLYSKVEIIDFLKILAEHNYILAITTLAKTDNAINSEKWLEKAANLGDTESMRTLADIYITGKEVRKDEALAAKWYEKAAKLNNELAMVKYAECLANGLGVKQNYGEAFKWLQQAKKGKPEIHSDIFYVEYGIELSINGKLRRIKVGNPEETKILRRSIILELLNHDNFPLDELIVLLDKRPDIFAQDKAFIDSLKLQQDKFNIEPQANSFANIVHFNEEEKNIPMFPGGNPDLAGLIGEFIYAEKAKANIFETKFIKSLNQNANVNLAAEEKQIEAKDSFSKISTQKCNNNLELAKAGDFAALQEIHSYKGYYTPAQITKLYTHLHAMVTDSDGESVKNTADIKLVTNLAYCFENGIGTIKSTDNAIRHYDFAASNDNINAIYALAKLTDETNNEYFFRVEKAANLGDVDSMVIIGEYYENGRGRIKNEELAAKWYKKAANYGNPQGIKEYAKCLANGIGVITDYKAADFWLKILERDHPEYYQSEFEDGNCIIYNFKRKFLNNQFRQPDQDVVNKSHVLEALNHDNLTLDFIFTEFGMHFTVIDIIRNGGNPDFANSLIEQEAQFKREEIRKQANTFGHVINFYREEKNIPEFPVDKPELAELISQFISGETEAEIFTNQLVGTLETPIAKENPADPEQKIPEIFIGCTPPPPTPRTWARRQEESKGEEKLHSPRINAGLESTKRW